MQVGETFVQGLFIIFHCSGQFGQSKKLLILFIFLIFYILFSKEEQLWKIFHMHSCQTLFLMERTNGTFLLPNS